MWCCRCRTPALSATNQVGPKMYLHSRSQWALLVCGFSDRSGPICFPTAASSTHVRAGISPSARRPTYPMVNVLVRRKHRPLTHHTASSSPYTFFTFQHASSSLMLNPIPHHSFSLTPPSHLAGPASTYSDAACVWRGLGAEHVVMLVFLG